MAKRFIILAVLVALFVAVPTNAAPCSKIPIYVKVDENQMTFTFYSGDTRIPYFYGAGTLVPKVWWTYHPAFGSDTEDVTFEVPSGLPVVADNGVCTWTVTKLPTGNNVLRVNGVAKKVKK